MVFFYITYLIIPSLSSGKFRIGDYGQRHQRFKLGLDPTLSTNAATALAREFSDPNASPPDYNHSSEKLVTDYLTALRKHAEQVLRHKLPDSALDFTPIEFVIMTSATWSDIAQAKTRSCVQKAGMDAGSALHIICGSKAAAMYASRKSFSHFLFNFPLVTRQHLAATLAVDPHSSITRPGQNRVRILWNQNHFSGHGYPSLEFGT